nr:HEAT repeat domain-containing protein [Actinoplanes digitatis]
MRAEVGRKAAMTVEELEREQSQWVAAADDEDERSARETRALFADVEEDRDQLVVDLAAYDAVRAGVPVYAAALADPHPAVRLYAAHLLAWFPEENTRSIPALTAAIAGDPSPIVAATASVAAGLCAGRPDDALTAALTGRLAAENRAERWSAAIGLARATTRPDRAALEELYGCLLEAGAPVPHWPFLDGDISTMAALTVARLGPDTAPDRVEVLALRLAGTRRRKDRSGLLGALLDAAFPGGIPRDTPGSALTPSQRTAARALVDARIWRDGATAAQLLAQFGLPTDRHALKAWTA